MSGFRADRIATLCMFHPLRRLIRTSAPRIPILMYHSISQLDESAKGPYYRIGTSPRVFGEQLRFLRTNGYQSIGLQQAVGLVEGAGRGPEKPVVLTFDDGYQDFYTEAFPLLSRFGYSASVFLPTAYIGDAALRFNGIECLTWSQIRELQKAGVEFGSHTVTHRKLRALGVDDIRDELRCSKSTIEEKLGCPVRSFSYPYAFPETDRQFKQTLRATLEEAGYETGVSTILGTAGPSSDRFFLERLPVNSGDDARFFRAKVDGGYDWLHAPQFAAKSWNGQHKSFIS
jgi:peptidoglycan/xylan/chitin deacetylase (PgdA/CDA1 family)